MMQHTAAEERYAAARAGTIEPPRHREHEKTREALRGALRDADVYVRCAAAMSLAESGGFALAPKVLDAEPRGTELYETAARQVEKQVKEA
ncbi:MAG: hypothetical protein U0694_02180 [Anaerolineae bacterium]